MKRPFRWRALLWGGALLLLTALACLLYLPQQQRVAALQKQIAAERQALAALEAFARRHPDLAVDEAAARRRLALAEAKLPENARIDAFLQSVEEAADRSGVLLRRVKPERPVRQAPCAYVPVQLECDGTYAETLAFLRALGAQPRFFALRQMFAAAAAGGLRTKFSLEVYFFDTAEEENRPQSGE